MNRRAFTTWWLGLLCLVGDPSAAHAQAAEQLWGYLALDWLTSERLTYELKIEPKTQPFVGCPEAVWVSLDTTPKVEYTVAKWVDVLAEVDVGHLRQSDGVNPLRVTPRVGVHLHIFPRIMFAGAGKGTAREKKPNKRVSVSTLVRIENPNTFDTAGSHPRKRDRQLRSRSELLYPLNRPRTTADGAVYVKSDGELFLPVNSAVVGGIVSELRLRGGIGYRRNFAWRFEALYIWIGDRDAQTGAIASRIHALNLRIRRQF
jgi:hypothetical protein